MQSYRYKRVCYIRRFNQALLSTLINVNSIICNKVGFNWNTNWSFLTFCCSFSLWISNARKKSSFHFKSLRRWEHWLFHINLMILLDIWFNFVTKWSAWFAKCENLLSYIHLRNSQNVLWFVLCKFDIQING